MDNVERFLQYAAAFERAYATDDWSAIEPFFAEDAVYETVAQAPFGSRTEGREAIKAFFRKSCNTFDRRFDSRRVELLEGPQNRGGTVWCRWAATYSLAGAPDLRMEGEETAHMESGRIRHLQDQIGESVSADVGKHMATYATRLRPDVE